MTKNEQIAYDFLTKKGWNPRKILHYEKIKIQDEIRPSKKDWRKEWRYPSGIPDFICSENRYVEAKTKGDGLSSNQIKIANLLLDLGYRYFIIYTDQHRGKIIAFFELKCP